LKRPNIFPFFFFVDLTKTLSEPEKDFFYFSHFYCHTATLADNQAVKCGSEVAVVAVKTGFAPIFPQESH
jgi:hypothetical protein